MRIKLTVECNLLIDKKQDFIVCLNSWRQGRKKANQNNCHKNIYKKDRDKTMSLQ